MGTTSWIRDPRYTGDNRCVSCTIVNLTVVALVAGALVAIGRTFVGVGTAVLGAGLVWQRGYLVPYTPRYAPRVVEQLPIPDRWFGKPAGGGSLADDREPSGKDVLETLVSTGVIRVDGEEILLEETFEAQWRTEMDALAELPPAELSEVIETVPSIESARSVDANDRRWFVVDDGYSMVPYPIVVAELAAIRTVSNVDGTDSTARAMARGLRQFLETCPVCETELVEGSTASCCGSPGDAKETRVCPDCEHRLFTIPDVDGEAN